MKKAVRLYLTGTVQALFFEPFIKAQAEKVKVKGFIRTLEDGRIEIFFEGDQTAVDFLMQLCKNKPPHCNIRGVEEKAERLQDFKDFKIFKF